MEQPLDSIKVIDLTTYVAGPSASRILADWGADVIKVESPKGDVIRSISILEGVPNEKDCDPAFQMCNANKRAISIDLKTEEGRNIMDKLLEKADVFLTNNRTLALKKMLLDYDVISKRHPHIVWAQINGWGEAGPMANYPGFDTVAYWANSGAMIDFTERNTAPIIPPIAFGDQNAAATLAGGIAAALVNKVKTGQGGKVIVSLYGQAIWNLGALVCSTQFKKDKYPKSRRDTTPLVNTYHCSDGEWMILCCFEYERFFSAVCKLIGREDIIEDSRFNTWKGSRENCKELISIIEDGFLKHTQDEWNKILSQAGVPHSKIKKIKDIVNDPQVLENNFIQKYTHRNGLSMYEALTPVQFDGIEPPVRKSAPLHGEHTVEIMKEIGYLQEEIEEMFANKVVFQK